ncbi:MAG: asparagine synthase (glutamine-hydrolyzing) [Deferribacteres bacterium]|nr:asparagine synthase (glutamine-hydrolyzing) [candidate division KSB1 bacterium]MCB9503350.1 asparagine synthase (glutamine-hydrolyzing) [Deferribacteres bacterium]
MCGIAGFINFGNGNQANERDLRRMCDVIIHRGPDEDGYFVYDNVALGMRRLSIIDLSTGKQPIPNEDKSIWIVFNGEIYNFPELRKELEAKGHKFRTKTDTETIVHAYEEWGTLCPTKLNGMFAFAIWDNRRKQLFLARDRLGIKPLYYYADRDRLVFGSELKSLLEIPEVPREVDEKALDLFLTYEYIPAPYSILKGVKKLPQGHILVAKDGKVEVQQYWEVKYNESEKSQPELEEEFIELMRDAVKIRMIADVPLGAFLSGGIDSSTIVALMSQVADRKVKTFSIGFENQSYNELEYAREIAKHFGTDHQEFIIQPDILDLTDKLIHHLDEPLGDFSIFPTYLVSKMARQHVTVALSGDGGDELFGGYDTYIANRMDMKYRQKVPQFVREKMISPLVGLLPPTEKKKGFINKSKRFVEGSNLPLELQHTRWMTFVAEHEKQALYTPDLLQARNGSSAFDFMRDYFNKAKSKDPLNRQLYVDTKTYLCDNILVKVDRMSMAVSLEARVPFLDYRVVEFAARVPGVMKMHNGRTKILVKDALQKLLPEKITNRGKEGFSIPIKNWLKSDLKPLMLDVLASDKIRRDNFFDVKTVERLIDEHLRNKENHSHRLWALMVFQIWQQTYLGK